MNRFSLPTLKIRKYTFIALFLFPFLSKAQSIVYYPFNSVLGISSNPNNLFWVDFRLFTNSYFTSVTGEISPQFTVYSTQKADYYTGVGVKVNFYNMFNNYNPVEGYFMNAGVKVRPFEKYKKLHIAFEISPYAAKEMDAGLFRTMLGIGYNFGQWK
jgi:hypothetical protein